jgi:RNA polymerase sigma-70 factor (ECF subfamily)
LVQDVLADLFRKLPGFSYDPHLGFRRWMRRVFHNKWVDHCRRVSRQLADDAEGLSDVIGAPQTDAGAMDERRMLVRRALEIMQSAFEPTTWKACWEFVAQDRPAADVAVELGMTENAVYIAKARVLRRLRAEMQGLID